MCREDKILVCYNSLKITTKDGKKHKFDWKQNQSSRDQAFSTLQELIGVEPTSNNVDDNSTPKEDEQPSKSESSESESSDSETEEVKPEKILAFSRFED